MKRYMPFIAAAIFSCSFFASCKEEASYTGKLERMRDTVLHSLAQVNGTTVEIKDGTMLNVVLISPTLEAGQDADKQKMADQVAVMAHNIFKGTDIDKGTVVFSKTDVTDMDAAMAGKTYDMHLEKY